MMTAATPMQAGMSHFAAGSRGRLPGSLYRLCAGRVSADRRAGRRRPEAPELGSSPTRPSGTPGWGPRPVEVDQGRRRFEGGLWHGGPVAPLRGGHRRRRGCGGRGGRGDASALAPRNAAAAAPAAATVPPTTVGGLVRSWVSMGAAVTGAAVTSATGSRSGSGCWFGFGLQLGFRFVAAQVREWFGLDGSRSASAVLAPVRARGRWRFGENGWAVAMATAARPTMIGADCGTGDAPLTSAGTATSGTPSKMSMAGRAISERDRQTEHAR